MPQHAAGIRDSGIQQQARRFQSACSKDDHLGTNVHFALRVTVDEERTVRLPGFLVERDLAYNGVRHHFQLAGFDRTRKQQVDRTGEPALALGRTHLGYADASGLAQLRHFLDSLGVRWIGLLNEVAVGKLRPAFLAAGHMEDLLHTGIERGQVVEADRPAVAAAVYFGGLELKVAQTERLPGPKQ